VQRLLTCADKHVVVLVSVWTPPNSCTFITIGSESDLDPMHIIMTCAASSSNVTVLNTLLKFRNSSSCLFFLMPPLVLNVLCKPQPTLKYTTHSTKVTATLSSFFMHQTSSANEWCYIYWLLQHIQGSREHHTSDILLQSYACDREIACRPGLSASRQPPNSTVKHMQ